MEANPQKFDKKLAPYVKSVFTYEGHGEQDTVLPFYADGYPGILFHNAVNGLYVRPQNKRLSPFFLYGQTIQPIQLYTSGPFRLIVFQLFPFAVRTLLGVNPKGLNDDCFDLTLLSNVDIEHWLNRLGATRDLSAQLEIVSAFLETLIQHSSIAPDQRVRLAINMILSSKGKIALATLRDNLHVTERTLERQFEDQVGVSPRQFIKIIQFSASLHQLSESDFRRLSDVAFDNEYADQSHFIRMFKKFTGKTPSEYLGTHW